MLPELRAEHNAFGLTVSETDTTKAGNVLWEGMLYDRPLVLYVTPNRPYDPATARWLSQDPIFADINLYRGMGNDPTNATDPSGRSVALVVDNDGYHSFIEVDLVICTRRQDGRIRKYWIGTLTASYAAIGYDGDDRNSREGCCGCCGATGKVAFSFKPDRRPTGTREFWADGDGGARDRRLVAWLLDYVGKDANWLYNEIHLAIDPDGQLEKKLATWGFTVRGGKVPNYYAVGNSCNDFSKQALDVWFGYLSWAGGVTGNLLVKSLDAAKWRPSYRPRQLPSNWPYPHPNVYPLEEPDGIGHLLSAGVGAVLAMQGCDKLGVVDPQKLEKR
jgi:RHS repeat-associated protein